MKIKLLLIKFVFLLIIFIPNNLQGEIRHSISDVELSYDHSQALVSDTNKYVDKSNLFFSLQVEALQLGIHANGYLNDKWSCGLGGGFGPGFINYMAAAGSHFSTENSFTSSKRDRYDNETFIEVAYFTAFAMYRKNALSLEMGIRLSGFIHIDDSDDDWGGGDGDGEGVG